MIDRSYLPFKSAREYIDRGMAKWMGFFISEHSTSLAKEDDSIDLSEQMESEKLLLLLSQVYIYQQNILLYTKKRKGAFVGTIHDISNQKIFFCTNDKTLSFNFEDIIRIEGINTD